MSRSRFVLAISIAVGATGVSAESPPRPDALIERGRLIYEAGQLGNGEPLLGQREGGVTSSGKAAACVTCHQRSGFGVFEGSNLVPPITGPSLFADARPSAHTPRRAKSVQHREFPFLARPVFDDTSLARAVREGISPGGHRFHFLMPRYTLSNADMQALTAYLRQLSAEPSPGADSQRISFATVIAPGQDPVRRQAVIDMLRACFQERHPEGKGRQAWQLSVWDLEGAPEGWRSQLGSKYAGHPVFAIVSGLGTHEWAPVHEFCEREKIPCLLPNIDALPEATKGHYSFYFSKGAVLEAQVVARYLAANASALGLRRVVQLRRETGVGAVAAEALRAAGMPAGMAVEDRILHGTDAEDARSLASELQDSDALVLWLNQSDLQSLATVAGKPPAVKLIMVSGLLGGWERTPLPPAWRRTLLMVHQIDAPARRAARMAFNLRPWLRGKEVAPADEVLIGNTLAACNVLHEGVLRLRGAFFRDYLVELTERYPTAMGNAPAPQAYPSFVLGPGQRFSSRGAYIVRFKAPELSELELVQDWTVP
jgi:hypothetical protein